MRLARVPRGEQRVEEGREERGRVPCDDEDACLAAEQLAARIREQEVQEGRDEQAPEERSQRVRECVVGLAQAADQNAEPDGDHQHSGSVLRPPRPAEQAGEDERPADEETECGGQGGVFLVVARDGQGDADRPGQKRGWPEVEPGAAGQAHWATSAR